MAGRAPGRQVIGVPARAVRSASSLLSWSVTGPGVPSPIFRPSIATTGAIPPMVPVTKISSAVWNCVSE
jgi:hypothetical protein